MSEKKILEQKTDNLEITQKTDNELNLEDLDNVAGGAMGMIDRDGTITWLNTNTRPGDPNQ